MLKNKLKTIPYFSSIFNTKANGQTTLLIVLMVMAVSLGVGVAVSQRQSSNLRRSTFTSQTDQAFSCANSAVEQALLCIRDREDAEEDPKGCSATNTPLDNTCNYSYTVTDLSAAGEGGTIIIPRLIKDSVQQFDLSNNSIGEVTIEFANFNNTDDPSAIEITQAYRDGSEYRMKKWLYTCGALSGDFDGFNPLNAVGEFCTITLDGSEGFENSAENIIRVRPYYHDVILKVSGDSAFENVVQGYKIESSGTAGNVTRNIKVLRMKPQLPPLFDYVLYSEEGSINK